MRKRMNAEGQAPQYRMWLFPWLTWGVILFIVGVLVLMLLRPDHRVEVTATALLSVLIVCSGLLVTRRRARGEQGATRLSVAER